MINAHVEHQRLCIIYLSNWTGRRTISRSINGKETDSNYSTSLLATFIRHLTIIHSHDSYWRRCLDVTGKIFPGSKCWRSKRRRREQDRIHSFVAESTTRAELDVFSNKLRGHFVSAVGLHHSFSHSCAIICVWRSMCHLSASVPVFIILIIVYPLNDVLLDRPLVFFPHNVSYWL